MKEDNPLLAHLQSPQFRDEQSRIIFPGQRHRLRPSFVGAPGGWQKVIIGIRGLHRFPSTMFPDANIVFRKDTEEVWHELRLAALVGAPPAVISAAVKQEAQAWLDDPHHHHDRAKAIKEALAKKTWLTTFGVNNDSPILSALYGYLRLLGLRRFLALAKPGDQTLVHTDPADKSGTMNMIGNKIGPRAKELARKGRKDLEKHGAISIHDELHCLLAIVHALTTGKETMILTADKDLVEIFYKAQWLLDTHYRGYCAAPMVKRGDFGEPAGVLDHTDGYFDGPITLYRRQTGHLMEVLPRICTYVRAGVIYVEPDDTIHKVDFMFEREMVGMLELRARTGRCTDLFGEKNIHVELGPLKRHLDGLYLGIGQDNGDWRETNGINTFLPRLDQEHCLSCMERFAS